MLIKWLWSQIIVKFQLFTVNQILSFCVILKEAILLFFWDQIHNRKPEIARIWKENNSFIMVGDFRSGFIQS